MFELHPSVLEHAGLEKALNELAEQASRRGGFECAVSVDPSAEGVDDRLVISLAREIIANSIQHANASKLDVAIARDDEGVVLKVRDDGVGFDPLMRKTALAQGHIGLASCSERCEARNGSLHLDTAPGRGTTVTAVIPVVVPPAARPAATVSRSERP